MYFKYQDIYVLYCSTSISLTCSILSTVDLYGKYLFAWSTSDARILNFGFNKEVSYQALQYSV